LLRGKSLAKLAWWGLLLVSLGVIILGIQAAPESTMFLSSAPEELSQVDFSPPVAQIPAFTALFLRVLMVAGFLTASLIIYWQRSDDRAALLFSALLMTVGVTNGVINYVPEPSAALKGV